MKSLTNQKDFQKLSFSLVEKQKLPRRGK